MEHVAAFLIATTAADANAIFGGFAGAVATAEIHVAHDHAVPSAAAAAKSAGEHVAEVLQGGSSNAVIAFAVDLETTGTLLEGHFAAWNHAPVSWHCGRSCWGCRGGGSSSETFHHDCGRHGGDSFHLDQSQSHSKMSLGKQG